MKKYFFIAMMMLAAITVSAQNLIDTTQWNGNKPQIKIKVNKIYDENGNVIGYDSSYAWSWSNVMGDTSFFINSDSLFGRFRPYFDEHFMHIPDPFSNRFFNDSSMYFDFFNNDHFFDTWQDELFHFKKEIERMDSLKQHFFREYLEKEKGKRSKGKIY